MVSSSQKTSSDKKGPPGIVILSNSSIRFHQINQINRLESWIGLLQLHSPIILNVGSGSHVRESDCKGSDDFNWSDYWRCRWWWIIKKNMKNVFIWTQSHCWASKVRPQRDHKGHCEGGLPIAIHYSTYQCTTHINAMDYITILPLFLSWWGLALTMGRWGPET